MPRSAPPDYRLGSLYSLLTAVLLAVQEPFSFLAARRLTTLQFVCLTQVALLISIPLVTLPRGAIRDFVALLDDRSNYPEAGGHPGDRPQRDSCSTTRA